MLNKTVNTGINWKKPSSKLDLSSKKNYLLRVSINDYFALIGEVYHLTISPEELMAANRYSSLKDRNRHIVSKYIQRTVLAKVISNCKPSEIQFEFTGQKKPYVRGVEFNVTHSGDYLLIATSAMPVGLDIELIDPTFDFDLIANHYFQADERNFIYSTGGSVPANFYTIWTRKEAVLKASGCGLNDELSKINSLNEHIVLDNLKYKFKSYNMDNIYMFSIADIYQNAPFEYWDYQEI